MDEKRIEIYRGMSGEVVFNVDADSGTIWATPEQMATVFGVQRPAIVKHLSNIYKSGELEISRTCSILEQVGNEGGRKVQRKIKVYNLDAIISVGYRVNSKKATQFRIWATDVLKRYLGDGVAINEQRLKALAEKQEVEKLHNVENMMTIIKRLTTGNELDAGEANGIIEVISRYAGSFKTLEEYGSGHINLSFLGARRRQRELTPEACLAAVEQLRESVDGTELFGKQRDAQAFEMQLGEIFQKYTSLAEKAANLLYYIIKERPFYDGNRRIGALLFVWYLTMNDYHLTDKGETKISDQALTAITLLIAESEPKEKELMISLICKLLG